MNKIKILNFLLGKDNASMPNAIWNGEFFGVTLPFRDKFSMSRYILVPNHSQMRAVFVRWLVPSLPNTTMRKFAKDKGMISAWRLLYLDVAHQAQAVLKDPKTNKMGNQFSARSQTL